MYLTQDSVDLLVDLVEIRLRSLTVNDRDDLKELNKLRLCKRELLSKNGSLHNSNDVKRKRSLNSNHRNQRFSYAESCH